MKTEKKVTPEMVAEWKEDLQLMLESTKTNLKRQSYYFDMITDNLKKIDYYEKSQKELDARSRGDEVVGSELNPHE